MVGKLVVHCPIWHHLYNLKNVKNTHGVLILVKLQAYFPAFGLNTERYFQIRSFFWSVLSRIRTKYGEIGSISPYSVQMRKPETLLKLTLLRGCFSRFLNCTNGTKSRNASHLEKLFSLQISLTCFCYRF